MWSSATSLPEGGDGHCPAAIFVLPETGSGEAVHTAGVRQASASEPGRKALSSYNVSPAASTDKV